MAAPPVDQPRHQPHQHGKCRADDAPWHCSDSGAVARRPCPGLGRLGERSRGLSHDSRNDRMAAAV